MIETLPLYDSFLDFLVEKATPEEILAFRAPESEQEQARQLIERNSAGLLTEPEQQQLEQMLQFERLVTRLKAKALAAMSAECHLRQQLLKAKLW